MFQPEPSGTVRAGNPAYTHRYLQFSLSDTCHGTHSSRRAAYGGFNRIPCLPQKVCNFGQTGLRDFDTVQVKYHVGGKKEVPRWLRFCWPRTTARSAICCGPRWSETASKWSL